MFVDERDGWKERVGEKREVGIEEGVDREGLE
jgi:hypothetical protein